MTRLPAVAALRESVRKAEEAAVEKELSAASATSEELRGVAHRVAMALLAQWRASAAVKGLKPVESQLTPAYNRFFATALQLGKQALKDVRASAALERLVASGGDASGSAQPFSKHDMTETFSVVIPLHSMSADFVVPFEK